MTVNMEMRPTTACIDLDALSSNFHNSKQFIGPDLGYMAVVKADAYGHGAIECALRLEREGVDWFGVAIPEEGLELRNAGIGAPILCLGSFWPGQEETIIDAALTPVIFDIGAAESLNRVAKGRSVTVDVHVKIDTGMGRAGIRFENSREFALGLRALANLRGAGLMTHFASAEDPREAEFTSLQIKRFNAAVEDFRKAGHALDWLDLANSPGAISHPASRGNLVRLGGALYGLLDDIMPAGKYGPELTPVLSLRSQIADVKNIPAGETLGYGRSFTTKRESKIALVPIGYADGYPRGLSNVSRVAINGNFASIVGRISMDWTLIDVTEIDSPKVGDEVVLIGNGITAAELARAINTIGYEITCGISPRVPRVYK